MDFREHKNYIATILGIVSGVLFLIYGLNGVNAWRSLEEIIVSVTQIASVKILFAIVIFFASFGGIIILAGAIAIYTERVQFGKILITIGVGSGIITLIIQTFLTIIQETKDFSWIGTASTIAIILSVIARTIAKSKKK